MSFGEVTLELLQGFGTTCMLFALTLVLSLPLGLLLGLASMSKFKPLKVVVRVFIWVIRGTPLMLQIIIIMFGPGLLGLHFSWPSRAFAAVVAFVINYSCYFAVIYRGGFESVPKGQYEAGQVLGMTKGQIFFHVVLFQVFRHILPPMSNEIITLVKDTSLAQVISVGEIIFVAQDIMNNIYVIYPLFYAGVFYLVFCGILTLLFGWLEKKTKFYKV